VERAALRAHLRACSECERLARSQRAQRAAWKALGAVPLPSSLGSLFGGAAGATAPIVAKAAMGVALSALVAAGAYEGVTHGVKGPAPAKAGLERQPSPPVSLAAQRV